MNTFKYIKKRKIIILLLAITVFYFLGFNYKNTSTATTRLDSLRKDLENIELNIRNFPRDEENKQEYKIKLKQYLIYCYENNLIDQALEYTDKAISHFYDDATIREIATVIYFRKAEIMLSQKKYDSTIYYLEKCREISEDKKFKKFINDVLIRQANNFYLKRDYNQTKRILHQVLNRDENNIFALYLLGEINVEKNNLIEALNYWERIPPEGIQQLNLYKKLSQLKKDIDLQKGYQKISWRNFNFFSPRNLTDISYELRRNVDRTYREIGRAFNYFPDYKVSIILYNPEDYRQISDALYPTAGLYDGKIRLPIGENTDKLYQVLRHEYTHLIVRSLGQDKVPVWFNEGLAEYQAGIGETRKNFLKQAVINNKTIPIRNLDYIFTNNINPEEVMLAYSKSFAIVDYIVERYNFQTVLNMIEDFSNDYSQQEVIKKRLNKTFAELETDVKNFIRRNY